MKLLSCSLYKSWDTIKGGSAALQDRKTNPSAKVSNLPAGHYDLGSLAKKIKNLFTNIDFHYDMLVVETNDPLGQLVIKNTGETQINLGDDLAKLFETGQILPLITNVKQILTTTSYFIHCDLIDKTNNLFNAKRSDLLAMFDITGKPYEKVRYNASSQQPFRDCSTDKHVNSITLSVRNQDGELFDFKGLPIEYELKLK